MSDSVDWLFRTLEHHTTAPALHWRGTTLGYAGLLDRITAVTADADRHRIVLGSLVAVVGDFSPNALAWLLVLARRGAIMVPLARATPQLHERCLRIAETGFVITIGGDDRYRIAATGVDARNPLTRGLQRRGDGGLVLFSSGSSAEPKAVLHALGPLLQKFRRPRRRLRTVAFLLFDHIGGFNTLLYTLANGACLVVPRDLGVAAVCDAIEAGRAELLPTTPSFLNLLLAAEAAQQRDLGSLRVISYGTEPMPEATLRRLRAAFPQVQLQQTYGLSEVGVMRSRSAADDSLLVRIGGEDYQTRVVDGRLQVKARSAMLGYLNAPTPFDADGWLDTGDRVEQVGDYYRILGRESDTINVGGQKVHPQPIEQLILELPEVIDVAVSGEPHPLLGQTLVARVQLTHEVPRLQLKRRVTRHCRGRLLPYMIPSRVEAVAGPLFGPRGKKARR